MQFCHNTQRKSHADPLTAAYAIFRPWMKHASANQMGCTQRASHDIKATKSKTPPNRLPKLFWNEFKLASKASLQRAYFRVSTMELERQHIPFQSKFTPKWTCHSIRILLQTRFFVCRKIRTFAYNLAQANCPSHVGSSESCCKRGFLFAARFAQSHSLT